ncbi:hypothetical protein AC781_07975 [Akkermansia glycaniphila]|nr:hypothetical protein AC781_07975 [Akkermansia glycaniphila]
MIINDDIIKNRPNILVAPNGFGKTSIATAFSSISKHTSIKLADKDRHMHSEENKPQIELTVDGNGCPENLKATENTRTNTVRKYFDIQVISDLRKIQAHTQYGSRRPKGKMIIPPIIICEKISREVSPYKIRELKQIFGLHADALPNMKSVLLESNIFIMRCLECNPYILTLTKKIHFDKIDEIRKQLSSYQGTMEEAKNAINQSLTALINHLPELKEFMTLIEKTGSIDQIDAFLLIWQILIIETNTPNALIKHLKWLRYSNIKKSLTQSIKDLNTSWKDVSIKETQGNLVVELPDPEHISNGQRDILILISLLYITRYNLTKERAILIIDEIFDYLDDANLTVAQYYISQLINDYKHQGRSIYTIILTHLNPSFFYNYVFSKQNIVYLKTDLQHHSTPAMQKLIAARSDKTIPNTLLENISKYLVHYHTDDYDFRTELRTVSGTKSSWGKAGKFQEFLMKEFKKYKGDQPSDPLAICAITRYSIEKLAFQQIEHLPNANPKFFDTHTTRHKLDYATSLNANIPESHYLLRIIFDDGLHWSPNQDTIPPISAKLTHPIIKKMIVNIVDLAYPDSIIQCIHS